MINIQQFPQYPVYVFHHLPKCGGTSILEVLYRWFLIVRDFRTGWTMNYPERADLQKLRSVHCICGHFEIDGFHLHQRYPETINSPNYRIFTFIRDPLQVRLSLYRFERENWGPSMVAGIEEYLFSSENYLARILPATEDNYREIIDRYFFVGVMDQAQASLDVLATMVGRKKCVMPWANKTQIDDKSTIKSLPDEITARFREENKLDYAIYSYCREKLSRTLAEYGGALSS